MNDLEKEILVLKVEESACFEALTALVPEEAGASWDVVGREETDVDREVPVGNTVGLEVVVAAPGPSPNAGTLPICFEVAMLAVLFCEVAEEVGLFDGSNNAAEVDIDTDDEAAADKCGLVCVVKVLDPIVAAPGPSPNAGTLPTCFDIVSEDAVEADSASIGKVDF